MRISNLNEDEKTNEKKRVTMSYIPEIKRDKLTDEDLFTKPNSENKKKPVRDSHVSTDSNIRLKSLIKPEDINDLNDNFLVDKIESKKGKSEEGGENLSEIYPTTEIYYEDEKRQKDTIFGEKFEEQAKRLRKNSPFGNCNSWKLFKVIVKSGEDLRQEQFATQLISEFYQIFHSSSVLLLHFHFQLISEYKAFHRVQSVKV